MPYLYENSKTNFSNFDHFKEVATKTLNEIFGRVKPIDVIDFDETKDTYKAVGYREGEEKIPPVTTKKQEQKAREDDQTNREKAEAEALKAAERIKKILEEGGTLTDDDKVIAANLGIELPAPEQTFTEHDVFNATDEALALAKEHNIDLKLVTGTGANGNIKVGDVREYIKAHGSNPAPVEENADDNGNEQPNA